MTEDPNHSYNDGQHSTLTIGTNTGLSERVKGSLVLVRALSNMGRESCARSIEAENLATYGAAALAKYGKGVA
jgi:hypothetical protein